MEYEQKIMMVRVLKPKKRRKIGTMIGQVKAWLMDLCTG